MRKSKRSIAAAWLLVWLSIVLLIGCGPREYGEMTEIVFERGHDSAWGNQFYIRMCPQEIIVTRYFPEGSTEFEIREHIPITKQQWETVTETIQAMDMQEKNTSWIKNLFKSRKLDGGQYSALTVIWDGETEVSYQWPDHQQARELEKMLEQLAVTVQ